MTSGTGDAPPTAVTDETVQAALAAAIAWQGNARQPLWAAPATGQVRAMLEAAAPLIAAAEGERIAKMADRNGAVCVGDEGTGCYFSALIRGGAHDA